MLFHVGIAIGRVMSARATELSSVTQRTTRDLIGKLPNADKVYLEQMMYASYCSALRDESHLTEAEKAARIRAYNREIRRALEDSASSAGTRRSAAEAARAALQGMPIPYTEDAFVEWAGRGDLKVARLFLTAGMNPNAKADEGYTVLMNAAAGGHAAVVKLLLDAKAAVNERFREDETALSWAAGQGRMEVLKLLLASGADAESIRLALLQAAAGGQLDATALLLQRSLDPKWMSEALRAAAASRTVDVDVRALDALARYLLSKGADVNARDGQGWRPLLQAAREGRTLLVQSLLDAGADINAQCVCHGYDGGGWTALGLAARIRDAKSLITLLLAHGAKPDLTNADGQIPLHVALDHGAGFEIVHALLNAAGMDVNARDRNGRTPLMYAVDSRDEIFRALLEAGVDVQAHDADGLTALMQAAAKDFDARVAALLDAGAEIEARDAKGRTALMWAVKKNAEDSVHVLLRRGAKVADRDMNGKSTLDYAREDLDGKRSTTMLRILTQADVK